MNSTKFIMALAAVCILVMPAFSMLDSGMGQDSKQKMWQGQDDGQKSCDCQKPCDCKEPCGCQKSMMCQDDKQMWQGQDDKQKECGCQKSMMGPDDEQKMCFGQDGTQKECGRHESMTGPDGKHIKSMMGDRDDNGSVKIVIVKLHV